MAALAALIRGGFRILYYVYNFKQLLVFRLKTIIITTKTRIIY
jgi:hypothetical protein